MHTSSPTMSSNPDFRVSLPLGLFCVVTLSWSLITALQESLTPDPHDTPSPPPAENQGTKPTLAPPAKHPTENHDSKLTQVNDGLDEDVYYEGSV